jgi:two-component system, NarL family, response regulator LiaR
MDHAHRSTALRIQLVDEPPIIEQGLWSLLRDCPHLRLVPQDGPHQLVDLTLFDCHAPGLAVGEGAERLAELARTGRVVAYTWAPTEALADRAVSLGAAGCMDKGLSQRRTIDALTRIGRGEVVREGLSPRRHGALSPREAAALDLIASGLSNDEIARELIVSINSVKTYIRSLYRKIGVSSRTQAVLWAVEHGVGSRTAPWSQDGASQDGAAAGETATLQRRRRLSLAPPFEDERPA